jgi:hypothetical protein
MIPEVQQTIIHKLVDRDWELMTTDWNINGGFISSNSPLVWGSLDDIEADVSKASLDDPSVEITFPLSNAHALVSYPGARHSNCTATDSTVAHINMRTLQLSMGLVFHPGPNFLLRRKSGSTPPRSTSPMLRRRDKTGWSVHNWVALSSRSNKRPSTIGSRLSSCMNATTTSSPTSGMQTFSGRRAAAI